MEFPLQISFREKLQQLQKFVFDSEPGEPVIVMVMKRFMTLRAERQKERLPAVFGEIGVIGVHGEADPVFQTVGHETEHTVDFRKDPGGSSAVKNQSLRKRIVDFPVSFAQLFDFSHDSTPFPAEKHSGAFFAISPIRSLLFRKSR